MVSSGCVEYAVGGLEFARFAKISVSAQHPIQRLDTGRALRRTSGPYFSQNLPAFSVLGGRGPFAVCAFARTRRGRRNVRFRRAIVAAFYAVARLPACMGQRADL